MPSDTQIRVHIRARTGYARFQLRLIQLLLRFHRVPGVFHLARFLSRIVYIALRIDAPKFMRTKWQFYRVMVDFPPFK